MSRKLLASVALIVFVGALAGCGGRGDRPTVVVYVALDELYSRPILDEFERDTGIKVVAHYDTEASKTTGLVNRLLAERDRPRADVFWNNEVVQTIKLKNAGVLAPYASPARAAIPAEFRDDEEYWTGFAARGRVIIYNTHLVQEPPVRVEDFLDPQWKGQAAIARPLFGTTVTHAAALFELWGEEKAKDFFEGLKANDVAILPGNATVRDLVARGEYAIGLTDTDDANGAIEDGLPAAWLFPDQGEGEMGALIIPNSVALLHNARHREAATRLIDYLLSPEVEAQLANMRSIQIPLNPAVARPAKVPDLAEVKAMAVDFDAVAHRLDAVMTYANEEFLP
jgi:iron(III) transport system substrate-binding protein